jgi:hypothetical protein
MGTPYDYSAQGAFGHHYGAGAESRETIIDNEQLRLLRIGYFISAGQTAVFIPFGLLYAVMGVVLPHLPAGSGSPPPPALMSWLFGIFGAVITAVAAVATLLKVLTAIRLKQRRSRVLCMVTAGLSCLEIPYGTALGLMTLIVLGRASVKRQFEEAQRVQG